MIAQIIVDVLSGEVDKVFDYKIPNDLSIKIGQRVVVPFGKRIVDGYVLDIKKTSKVAPNLLKNILSIKDKNVEILPEMIDLCKFMVKKYNIRYIDALRLCINNEVRKGNVKPLIEKWYRIDDKFDVDKYIKSLRKNSTKQIDLLRRMSGVSANHSELCAEGFATPLRTLVRKGAFFVFFKDKKRIPDTMQTQTIAIKPNPDQQNAIEKISEFKNKTYVLFGVTGSGKTEVYINIIQNALKIGKTALLLVPEIALTPQMSGSLRAKFGETVAILHSRLTQGEKFDEWQRILKGEAKVVVGARSAIFAPVQNLGVIIIDEEHENSYNSETNPRYKTIEIAQFRHNYNNCPLVLGSATPSICTYQKTQTAEYELLELPRRVHETEMPKIQIVDMTNEIRAGNDGIFSRQLIHDLENCFKTNKQAILFLNRRGYTSFMRCSECGYIAKCTDCDAPLVYHKIDNALKCHFCGKKFKPLTICPNCKSIHIRQGAIGTQKVVDEIKTLFPDIKILRMDNDSTKNKNGYQKILEEFNNTKPAILVGTQMIAKGHDFSDVEIVGIIDADQSLYQSDYHSAEKTFQLITQVSGRAGRKNGGGKIVLQTYSPNHYVYKFASRYNFKGFFDKEINIRETTNFPPFSTIIRILVANEKEKLALKLTKDIFVQLKKLKTIYDKKIYFLNAMKSPHAKLKNKFRFQILLRFTKALECAIMSDIYKIVNKFKNRKSSIFVEVDPNNLS